MSNPTPTPPTATETDPATGPTEVVNTSGEPEKVLTSEQLTNAADNDQDAEQADPKPTETVDYWKQHARTWETRAKDNHAAAKKLPEAETTAAEATTRAETAETRAQALTIALANRLNPDDVDLLIGAGEEAKMQALAARLSQGSAPYVPDQGTDNAPPKPDKQREFVRGLFNRND